VTSEIVKHHFGGAWTEIKLEILRSYLNFYTTALKNQGFELLYIDAFAGSGSRTEQIPESPIFAESERTIVHDGSAKIALNIDPPFDRYLFIDNNQERVTQLEKLRNSYPKTYISVTNDDANTVIQTMAKKPIWQSNNYRGVIFLDPYGNNVEWQTLQAISSTQSFDLWFLFPLSGVYRQTPTDFRKLEDYKRENLNKIFGTNSWEADFYCKHEEQDLLGASEKVVRIEVNEIEKWVKARLEACFYHVSNPLALPQRGAQLFSLFFCISNRSNKAVGLALKAANHILKQHGK
jgi:three-Cys-motif partner protein